MVMKAEISHRHTAVHNKLASKPYGGDYGGIHTKGFHNGLKEYHKPLAPHTGLCCRCLRAANFCCSKSSRTKDFNTLTFVMFSLNGVG